MTKYDLVYFQINNENFFVFQLEKILKSEPKVLIVFIEQVFFEGKLHASNDRASFKRLVQISNVLTCNLCKKSDS